MDVLPLALDQTKARSSDRHSQESTALNSVRAWLAVSIITTLVTWAMAAWLVLSHPELAYWGMALLAVSVMAAGFHAARWRANRRLEDVLATAGSSREYYRQLLSQTKDAVAISTPDGRLLDVNPAAIELFGATTKDELLSRDVGDLYADPDERQVLLRELEEKGFVRDYITHLKTLDGRRLDVEGTTSAARDEDGRLVALLAILRDVTGRKLEEEALRKTRDELEELVRESLAEKVLLHKITAAANQAAEPDEAITASLHEVCAFTGWPVGHAYELAPDGWKLEPTRLWYLEEGERFDTFRRVTERTSFVAGEGLPGRVLASGEPAWIVDVTKDSNFPRARVAQDIGVRGGFGFPVVVGGEVAIVLEFFTVEAAEPDPALLQVMAEVGKQLGRVIERQRIEAQRRQLEAQVQQAQKLESLGVLAGGIAHDFNNLLMVITGYSELLLQAHRGDGEEPDRFLVAIDQAARRAASLTRRLLAFSRRQIVQPANLDLAEVVEEVDEMLRYLLGQRVELKVRLKPGVCWVRVDPGQIEQIVVNLAVNARDAMPDGGELRIETQIAELAGDRAQQLGLESGSYAALSVSDTGCGMDEETVRHIFEPFFTTKTSGRGTGLGLATVKAILEQIGGAVEVESEPGSGSTFRAYLPLIDETIHGAAAGREGQDLSGSDSILVVENDEPVGAVLATILEGKGYRVLSAHDAASALAMLEAGEDVRLLLTEAVMPGISGLELAAQARAARPGLDVLLMSGYSKDGSSRLIDAEDHSVALIQKPFSTDQLLRKLREVLHPG